MLYLYEHFRKNETYVINIGTDRFRSSPLHYVEKVSKVPYIFDKSKNFRGIFIDKKNNKKNIIQSHGGQSIYKEKCVFNFEKINLFLQKNNAIKESFYKNIKVISINNQKMHSFLENKLSKDPYFMVTF